MEPHKGQYRLRRRALRLFALVAGIPLILASVLIGLDNARINISSAQALEQETALRVAAEVRAFFREAEQELAILDRFHEFGSLDQALQRRYLSQLLMTKDVFEDLRFVDSAGTVKAYAARTDVRFSAQHPVEVKPTELGSFIHFGDVTRDTATGEPRMPISLPLRNLRSGEAYGTIIATVRLGAIQDLLRAIRTNTGEDVYLLDAQNRILAHRNPTYVLKGTQFKPSKKIGIQEGLGGQWVILATEKVHKGGKLMRAVAERNLTQALAPVIKQLTPLVAILVFSLILASFLAITAAKHIVSSIEKLARLAHVIKDGDLSERVDIDRPDEIGDLAHSFNAMAENLSRSLISKDFFDDVLTAAGEGIYGIDHEGRTTFVNPAATQMFRCTAQELIGQRHHDVFHHTRADGTSYPSEESLIHTALLDGQVYRVDDDIFWRKDGTSFPVEYVATPILKEGKVTGGVVVFKDISERKEAEAEILRQKRTSERYLNIVGSMIIALDKQGRITLANRRSNEILGYAEGELIGKDWFDTCLPSETNHTIKGMFNQTVAGEIEGAEYFENEVITKSGERRLIAWQNRSLFDHKDNIIGTLSAGEDITQQRAAEKNLAEQHAVLEMVDRTLTRFIGHRNSTKGFAAVLVDLLKLTESQYGFIAECKTEEDGTPCLKAIANITKHESSHSLDDEHALTGSMFSELDGRFAAAVANGETIITNEPTNHSNNRSILTGHPPLNTFLGVPLQRGEKIIGVVGITNRKQGYSEAMVERLMPFWSALAEIIEARRIDMEREDSQREIKRLAHYDVLTGLPNRALFQHRLDWAVKQVRRYNHSFALLLLDLDHFKDVNDTQGHPIGDSLLVATAERLKEEIHEPDVVARIGGDEFAILQMGPENIGAAATYAHRICSILAEPFNIKGNQIHTGASIGIALCSPGGGEPTELFTQADTALYRAKAKGRGGFRFYDPQMEAEIRHRVEIIEDLYQAIREKQFRLFFQPQIDIAEQRLAGCEALIRWNHPERGLVPPDVFIPIAEESGQLLAIDDWILNESCRQLRAWQVQGLMQDVTVAVNISPLQFKTAGFEDKVIAALEQSKLDPRYLELEVTERILAERPDEVAEIMHRLNKRGIKFSIDDFGTGYSSLQYLKTLPVSKIKIAQEFVREMLEDSNDAAIINAIIGLSQDFGLQILAEGVETAGQLSYLRRKGCGLIQGYYFSKPVPPDRVEKWAAEELPKLLGYSSPTGSKNIRDLPKKEVLID